MSTLQVLAIDVAEQQVGFSLGRWHTIYTRMNRWAKNRVRQGIRTSAARTIVRVKPRRSRWTDSQSASRRHGGVKKNGPQSIGKSRGGWTTKIHMVAADAGMTFSLCPRRTGGPQAAPPPGASAKEPVYSDGSCIRGQRDAPTRELELGFAPVVPPLSSRVAPWEYDKELYKRRKGRAAFRRLKGFRRIFSRFDKLDVLFLGFILLALIFDALRSVNTP